MGALAALIISGIAAAAGGALASIASSANQKKATQEANATNLEIAQQNNETQLDIAKNGLTYKMQDAVGAGLNPVFVAQSGGATPSVTLDRPQVQPAYMDYNGVGNAMTAMTNMMLTAYLMDSRMNTQKDIAQGYQNTSMANNQARNSVLKDLYKRKAAYFRNPSASGGKFVSSAKQISDMTAADDLKWNEIQKELKQMPYKFKFRGRRK